MDHGPGGQHCSDHTNYAAGCTGCKAARRRAYRIIQRAKVTGQWQPWGDGVAVTNHIRKLHKAGVRLSYIAEQVGLTERAIGLYRAGGVRVRTKTAEAILAIRPGDDRGGLYVSSLGASRRLRALAAAGWSSVALAERLGSGRRQVAAWRTRHDPTILRVNHEKICKLYREIGDTPGGNAYAAGQARARGWWPPVYWDDDGDLDNPRGRPQTAGMNRNNAA